MPAVSLSDAALPLVLALDIGTSSTRALLFDRRGRAIRDSESQISFDMTTTPDGGAEIDAALLFDLVCQSIDTVSQVNNVEIAAIGISCFWHSLVGLNSIGNPVTPVYLWADTRSREEVDAIKSEFDPHQLWQRTGCFVHSSYWPGKLRWIARTEPEIAEKVIRWCAFSDYVLRRLFNVDGTSVSMASSTAMLNATTLRWDEMAIAAAGIDASLLPEIIDQRTRLVNMQSEFAMRWPLLDSVPWFFGIGDGACANVGSGGIGPDRIALTVGTSGAVRMVKPAVAGQSLGTPESLWTYRLDEGRAVVGAAISNGGKVIDWLADLTGTEIDGEIAQAAALLAPDAHGLTMLPFLAGERAPIWNDWATGGVVGLRLSTTQADLMRAGMESVSYRLAWLYRDVTSEAEVEHQIIANGGAILRSDAWLQMMADVVQHQIIALAADEEASARGAAILALEYAGIIDSLTEVDDPVETGRVFEPNPANAAAYQSGMDRQHTLLTSLYDPDGRPRI